MRALVEDTSSLAGLKLQTTALSLSGEIGNRGSSCIDLSMRRASFDSCQSAERHLL